MTAFVIFNPNADNGRTGRDWQAIEEALESIFPLMSFFVTTAPGQAARMVRDALRDGHFEIIAVGGDGTINEALNGFFDRGLLVTPEAVFSFVHGGSDSALCQRFGIPPGWREGITHLKQARIRKADIGRVNCLSPDGAPVTRYFLASASLGLPGSIARILGRARIARFFGNRFAHRLHGLVTKLRWRATRLRLMADGYDEIAGITSVRVIPRDGAFDMRVVDGSRKILTEDGARKLRTPRLTAAPTLDTQGLVDVETDGESAGVLPATFDVYPDAINLRA